jgi:hypothetical protein
MRKKLLSILLFATSTAFAQPVVTSISPSSGPVTGGTSITIRGAGFKDACTSSACGGINIGDLRITSFQVIDNNTIVATTTPHLPGAYTVERVQANGAARLSHAFTFEGDSSEAFDRLLLPVFIPTTPGAFSSQFISRFTMLNKADAPLDVYGVRFPCFIECPSPETMATTIEKDNAVTNLLQTGHPGTFLFVPKGRADDFTGTLRVQDLSRQAETWGTEIPIVRDRDFTTGTTNLLDVPLHEGFRETLRVYAATDGLVRARVYETADSPGLLSEQIIPLRAPKDIHDPGYGELGLYIAGNVGRIEIEPLTPGLRYWAFVSVTNNETQNITTITPH